MYRLESQNGPGIQNSRSGSQVQNNTRFKVHMVLGSLRVSNLRTSLGHLQEFVGK